MNQRSMEACQGILFDFGGTLDSDGEHWLDRFFDLYERVGLEVPQLDIKQAFYAADEACNGDPGLANFGLRPLMSHHVRLQFEILGIHAPAEESAMINGFCRHSEAILARNAALLRRFGKRYQMGVVSNFYGNVAALCREADFSDVLSCILDSSVVGVWKPDPAMFQMALHLLDLPSDRVLFVGDSLERDILPARSIGMQTLWMRGPKPRIPANLDFEPLWISNLPQVEAVLSGEG
jgi:FMN phosphatase YigB (HAD superfamily)